MKPAKITGKSFSSKGKTNLVAALSLKSRAAEADLPVRPALGGPRAHARAVPSGGPRASDAHIKRCAGPGIRVSRPGECRASIWFECAREEKQTPPERQLGRGPKERTVIPFLSGIASMSRARGGQWQVAIGPIAYVFECSLHRSTHIFRTQNACEGPRLYAAASLKSTRLRKLFNSDA